MQKFKYINKNKLGSLPKTAGVYAFKKGADFLYIGKAINIQSRVKNHFNQPVFKDAAFIIPNTNKLGYTKTESEIEALLLEAELIKKHKPKYNVIWKDDKNYSFVEITENEFPKISVQHQMKKGMQYIGPFVDGKALRQTLKIIRKVFPYRTCGSLPNKKCLFYDLKLCNAPCVIQITKKEYQKNINNLIKILRGKKQQVVLSIKKEMKEMSKTQNFEKALISRNQMFALENVFQNAHIIKDLPKKEITWSETEKRLRALLNIKKKITRIEGYDVSNIQGKLSTGSMVVFENGAPNKKEYKKFKIKMEQKPNDTAMLKEILQRRFTHAEWPTPQVILIDGGKGQLNTAIKAKMKTSKYKNIKILSIAKRNNELFIEGKTKPLLLKELYSGISDLILQLRDESHRFAIKYHKKLRRKKLIG